MDRHKVIISDSGQGYRGPGGGVEELRLERGVRSQGESRRSAGLPSHSHSHGKVLAGL